MLPLIEPIGFESSTLRRKAELVEAIEVVGGPSRFKLVHDTFQHAIAGEAKIFPAYTALVHISGISDPTVLLDASQDAHRILVKPTDRCGTLEQVEVLLNGGYPGAFSFECTDRSVQSAADPAAVIDSSFEFIEHRVWK